LTNGTNQERENEMKEEIRKGNSAVALAMYFAE